MENIVNRLQRRIFKNNYTIDRTVAKKNRVNVEFWNVRDNVGDQLSIPIVEWMLQKKGIDINKPVSKTKHLLALGSIIGSGRFDATVWGSGINTAIAAYWTGRCRNSATLDIRAVRGPLTKEVLEGFGYDCSKCVYGDPGILMPYVFPCDTSNKEYDISIICHFKTVEYMKSKYPQYNFISVETKDYKGFINDICLSRKVISSSLHGIILSEAYGIPVVFYNEAGLMDREIVKYYDWYYSTGRRSVLCATNIEEAINAIPMELPNLDSMRSELMRVFPYGLWEING